MENQFFELFEIWNVNIGPSNVSFKNIFMNAGLPTLYETDTNFLILNGTPCIFFHFRILDVILNKFISAFPIHISNIFEMTKFKSFRVVADPQEIFFGG